MSWIVRLGKREDIGAIVGFQLAMAWETEEFALDKETVIAGVTAVFDDPGKGRYWVTEDKGKVIGSLLTLPEWSDWRNGQVWWIHSVYITPSHRKQGVFRAMYNQLKEETYSDPTARGLRLYVDKRNHKAQAVYQSLGMNDEHYSLFEWMPSDGNGSE